MPQKRPTMRNCVRCKGRAVPPGAARTLQHMASLVFPFRFQIRRPSSVSKLVGLFSLPLHPRSPLSPFPSPLSHPLPARSSFHFHHSNSLLLFVAVDCLDAPRPILGGLRHGPRCSRAHVPTRHPLAAVSAAIFLARSFLGLSSFVAFLVLFRTRARLCFCFLSIIERILPRNKTSLETQRRGTCPSVAGHRSAEERGDDGAMIESGGKRRPACSTKRYPETVTGVGSRRAREAC